MRHRNSFLRLFAIFTLPVLILSSYFPVNASHNHNVISVDKIAPADSLKEALVLFDSSKYEEALIIFENILNKHLTTDLQNKDSTWWTDFLKYNNYLAQTLNELSDHQSVIDNLEQVLKTLPAAQNQGQPEIAKTHTQLGIAYLKLEKLDLAYHAHNTALNIRLASLPENHPDITESYYNIGLTFAERGKLDTAIIFYEKALKLYADSVKYYDRSAPVITSIGIIYYNQGKFENALNYFKKALEKNIKIRGENHQDVAGLYNNIGVVYYKIGKYEEASFYFEKALMIKKEVLSEDHIDLAYSYNNKGLLMSILGKYELAILEYKKALKIKIHQFGQEHSSVAATYTNLGNAYLNAGKYGQAHIQYQKALGILKKILNDTDPKLVNIYASMGDLHAHQNQDDIALDYYSKALQIVESTLGKNHFKAATIHNNIARTRERLWDLDQALQDYSTALSIYREVLGEDHGETAMGYHNIGSVHYNMGAYTTALEYLTKGLEIRNKKFGAKDERIASSHLRIGEAYSKSGDIEMALAHSQKALTALTLDFDNSNIYSLPENLDNVISRDIMFRTLKQKGNLLFNRYLQYHNKNDLLASARSYQLGVDLLDYMRKELNWSSSKKVLYDNSFLIFGKGIRAYFELYSITDDDQYLSRAFDLMEKSKSILLLESIQNSHVKEFYSLPPELLQKEYDIQTSITYYERKIFEEESRKENFDEKMLDYYREQLLNLQHSYDSLLTIYQNDYENYFNLKHNLNTCSLQEVQESILGKNEALLEYFVGDSYIYVFLITADNKKLYNFKKDFPLEAWINVFRHNMLSYHTSGYRSEILYKANSDTLVAMSNRLFQRLVQPLCDDQVLPDRLIIIPAGSLSYLPFEVLLKSLPENSEHFSQHQYLLNDYVISYCYSATLLREMKSRKQSQKSLKSFLAFAPSFEQNGKKDSLLVQGNRGGLNRLEYNIEEVELINSIFRGTVFAGNQATKFNFLSEAPNYKIIHLATHGKSNDKAEDFSYLAFSRQADSLNHDLVYTRDLYNLKLNADMVVLSACETGLGKLQKGEGVVSLARGFSYAGTKSIVTSLWSVNDRATIQLMNDFYQYLEAGIPKDQALRKAKLDFIQNHPNDQAHPFFWGAFIPIGSMEPIETNNYQWWFILVILGLAFIAYRFWIFKK
jgi:CHAT domain-containing protein/Tfp pilus assembly protein PilF